MMLLATVTAALYCFVRGMSDGRPLFYRGFFLFTGLATLIVGPAGILAPLLGVVLFALTSRRLTLLVEMRIPSGLLVWLLVVLPWAIIAGVSAGSDHLAAVLLGSGAGEFGATHAPPWHRPVTVLPVELFPWSIFLPGAVWLGWRRATGTARRGFEFALAWVVATLAVLVFSPGSRLVLLPTLYPAAALIVACSLVEIRGSWPWLRRYLTLPTTLIVVLSVAISAALWMVSLRIFPALAPLIESTLAELRPTDAGLRVAFGVLGLGLAATTIAGRIAARSGRVRLLARIYFAGAGTIFAAVAVLVLPRLDATHSLRPLAEELVARASADEPYAIWPRTDPAVVFYSGRLATDLADHDALETFVNRPGPVWLLIGEDEVGRLPQRLPLVEVARNGRRLLLTTRQPDDRRP
jgi:4-amino-4-deoxy-L-arabinose transferase-like glycosyltransferase